MHAQELTENISSEQSDGIFSLPFDSRQGGLFARDIGVQTEITELTSLKDLSKNATALRKEMEAITTDLSLKMRFVEAQCEVRLQKEAESLFQSFHTSMKVVVALHQEKIMVLRRSFRQQFHNAMQVIHNSYKSNSLRQSVYVPEDKAMTKKIKVLETTVKDKDSTIQSLTEQLADYENKSLKKIRPDSVPDMEKTWLKEENVKLKDKLGTTCEKLETAFTQLDAKEVEVQKLDVIVEKLKAGAEEDRRTIVKAKLALKKKMETPMAAVSTLVQSPSQPIFPAPAGDQLTHQLEKMMRNEKQHLQLIERLQKQLANSEHISEKKCEVLRQSLLAVKDEMFLRQTLQRQAVSLRHASVSYAVVSPAQNQGTVSGFSTVTVKPLFEVANQRARLEMESQLLMDTDGYGAAEGLVGILPLPHPPAHNRQTT